MQPPPAITTAEAAAVALRRHSEPSPAITADEAITTSGPCLLDATARNLTRVQRNHPLPSKTSMPVRQGVYALAAQVDPDITPDALSCTALETGRTIGVEYEDETILLGPIVDPVALVAGLEGR